MSKDAKPRGTIGRPKGSVNKSTRDLREVILQAFHKAGSRDYLVKVAHQRPDIFLALVGKIIPQETRLSVMASYQALPIPVEQREAGPLPALGAPVTVIPTLAEDWLEIAPDDLLAPPSPMVTSAYGPMVNDTPALDAIEGSLAD